MSCLLSILRASVTAVLIMPRIKSICAWKPSRTFCLSLQQEPCISQIIKSHHSYVQLIPTISIKIISSLVISPRDATHRSNRPCVKQITTSIWAMMIPLVYTLRRDDNSKGTLKMMRSWCSNSSSCFSLLFQPSSILSPLPVWMEYLYNDMQLICFALLLFYWIVGVQHMDLVWTT
jgi:hypothetical protein